MITSEPGLQSMRKQDRSFAADFSKTLEEFSSSSQQFRAWNSSRHQHHRLIWKRFKTKKVYISHVRGEVLISVLWNEASRGCCRGGSTRPNCSFLRLAESHQIRAAGSVRRSLQLSAPLILTPCGRESSPSTMAASTHPSTHPAQRWKGQESAAERISAPFHQVLQFRPWF